MDVKSIELLPIICIINIRKLFIQIILHLKFQEFRIRKIKISRFFFNLS